MSYQPDRWWHEWHVYAWLRDAPTPTLIGAYSQRDIATAQGNACALWWSADRIVFICCYDINAETYVGPDPDAFNPWRQGAALSPAAGKDGAE